MKWYESICRIIRRLFKRNKNNSDEFDWELLLFGRGSSTKERASDISEFQKKHELKETGVIDGPTLRRKYTEHESIVTLIEDKVEETRKNEIICDGKKIPIEWSLIRTFNNIKGLELPENCYKKYDGHREPTMFVAHWDVCLSSQSCFNVLKKRGISVHFCIDNDGTIYQLMDTNDIGWHAGNRKVNAASIGVEISNAYYLKYQETYRLKHFGLRPVWKNSRVHGRTLEPHLGFYDVQIQAFKALAKALNLAYGIPLIAPMENNKFVETIYDDAAKAKFKGVVSHYHITKRKIDCAGLNLDEVLK